MLSKQTATQIVSQLNNPGYASIRHPPAEWMCASVGSSDTQPGFVEVKLTRSYRFARFPNRCTALIKWDENLDNLGPFIDRLSELLNARLPDLQDYYPPPPAEVSQWLDMQPDKSAKAIALWVEKQDAAKGVFSVERCGIELTLDRDTAANSVPSIPPDGSPGPRSASAARNGSAARERKYRFRR